MAVIIATWTPPDYAFIRDYLLDLSQGLTIIESVVIPVGTERYESPTVADNQDFTITVRVRSTLGPISVPVSITIHTTGNTVGRYAFVAPTLVNMYEMYDYATGRKYWVTAMNDHWQSTFTTGIQSYSNPLLSYHSSGTSTLTTEEYDLGAEVNANFVSDIETVAINGTPIDYIELRDNIGDPWTRHAGLSFTGSARRVRLSSETTGTDSQRVNDLGEIIATV